MGETLETERKWPSKKTLTRFIHEFCGNNPNYPKGIRLAEDADHGFRELPSLKFFWPYLDFLELFGFAASSWRSRDSGSRGNYDGFLKIDNDPLVVFNFVLGMAIRRIYAIKKISPEMMEIYDKLNPFTNSGYGARQINIESRLRRVNPEHAALLVKELKQETKIYTFEGSKKRKEAKDKQEKTGQEIFLMPFQPTYPRPDRIFKAYVRDIAEILKKYPEIYYPMRETAEKNRQGPEQLILLDVPLNEQRNIRPDGKRRR